MISPTASAIPVERGGPAAEGEARSSRPSLGSVNSSKRGSATDSRNSAGYQPLRERAGGSDDRYAFRAGNTSKHQSLPAKLRVLSLFAGIGGFELGLERTGGFETVAQCEIDPFCRRVLEKHWPHVKRYDDVRTLTADTLRRDGIAVDVICGGFPCQDISTASQAPVGLDGSRSGLWTEFRRLIREIRPGYAIVENVSALRGNGLDRILRDLASIGYDAEWHCIPASAVGASHPRDRVWIVAYATPGVGQEQRRPEPRRLISSNGLYTFVLHEGREDCFAGWRAAEPGVARGVYGVPNRVDRFAALSNAVVPQIPELIGHAILASLRESVAA